MRCSTPIWRILRVLQAHACFQFRQIKQGWNHFPSSRHSFRAGTNTRARNTSRLKHSIIIRKTASQHGLRRPRCQHPWRWLESKIFPKHVHSVIRSRWITRRIWTFDGASATLLVRKAYSALFRKTDEWKTRDILSAASQETVHSDALQIKENSSS